jgi:hypothetical protein
MVTPSAGDVVLVPFPFSDLSQSKVRPAVCRSTNSLQSKAQMGRHDVSPGHLAWENGTAIGNVVPTGWSES